MDQLLLEFVRRATAHTLGATSGHMNVRALVEHYLELVEVGSDKARRPDARPRGCLPTAFPYSVGTNIWAPVLPV
jgi:hypothetical protein